MVCILMCWCLIADCAATIGQSILRFLGAEAAFEDTVDRTIIAIWIGLGSAAVFSLGVGLFFAVGPWTGGVILTTAIVQAIRDSFHRSSHSAIKRNLIGYLNTNFLHFRYRLNRYRFAYCVLIVVILAFHTATTKVDAYDTGLYHQQAVSWLSHYGFVRGLAWLHFRLGFTSSWFALAAVFNHGFLNGRVGPILGGFVTTVGILHWIVKVDRVLTRTAEPPDWFLVLVYPPMFCSAWLWHYETSLSPDLATWTITALVVWAGMLLASCDLSPRASYVPLLLAAFGYSLKSSLLPLLPVTLFFPLLTRHKAPPRRINVISIALCSIPVLLTTLANVITSGCPLYPSPVGCVTKEWAVSQSFARWVMLDTRNFARWSDAGPVTGGNDWLWIRSWVDRKDRLFLVVIVIIGAAILVHRSTMERSWLLFWILAVGFSGLGFLFWGAPNPRFGFGFFLVLPAAAFAVTIGHSQLSRPGFSKVAMGLVLVGVFCAAVRVRTELKVLGVAQLFVPEAMPDRDGALFHIFYRGNDRWTRMQTEIVVNGNLRFLKPLYWNQCWNLPLPCSSENVDSRLQLLGPGLGGGFVRR